jgi:3-hydroxybutyrate dehydrogenase/3-oxoacyl-[acyl-carrier protein] reductase
MNLNGKVAVITGGTGGIGLGIARRFVDNGANLVVTGRTPERGEKAVAELGGEGRVHFVAGDASDQAHLEAAIDTAVQRFGRLDILVNNSGGIQDFSMIADMSNEAWDRVIRWNLYGPFYAARHALKYFIPQKSGRIINMSSLEGKHGKPGVTQYVSAKHGLHGLTKGLAQEVGAVGVTVNAVCPGVVQTALLDAAASHAAAMTGLKADELLGIYAQESAIKRFTTVEEVAALVLLLASEDGSGITGAMLNVDGGSAAY